MRFDTDKPDHDTIKAQIVNDTIKAQKQKYPRALACAVARELVAVLQPVTDRLILAGSLRRRKPEVGDIEILYVPTVGLGQPAGEMFYRICNLADIAIQELELRGVLGRRRNAKGSEIMGERNKLMVHVQTGVPVDLFAATQENWFNYLVCRTGSSAMNVKICMAARARGLHWMPYGAGFRGAGHIYPCTSEREVFDKVGLPYLEPWER